MPKPKTPRGRPRGTTTCDTELAKAFGHILRNRRQAKSIGQEKLAYLANVERSHMGKIERGEHMPSMVIILRISNALEIKSSELIADMEERMEHDKMMENLRQT